MKRIAVERVKVSYTCRQCQNRCEPALDQLCDTCRAVAPTVRGERDIRWEALGGGTERCKVPGGYLYSKNGSICFAPDERGG